MEEMTSKSHKVVNSDSIKCVKDLFMDSDQKSSESRLAILYHFRSPITITSKRRFQLGWKSPVHSLLAVRPYFARGSMNVY
jgi:hypothetical protein